MVFDHELDSGKEIYIDYFNFEGGNVDYNRISENRFEFNISFIDIPDESNSRPLEIDATRENVDGISDVASFEFDFYLDNNPPRINVKDFAVDRRRFNRTFDIDESNIVNLSFSGDFYEKLIESPGSLETELSISENYDDNLYDLNITVCDPLNCSNKIVNVYHSLQGPEISFKNEDVFDEWAAGINVFATVDDVIGVTEFGYCFSSCEENDRVIVESDYTNADLNEIERITFLDEMNQDVIFYAKDTIGNENFESRRIKIDDTKPKTTWVDYSQYNENMFVLDLEVDKLNGSEIRDTKYCLIEGNLSNVSYSNCDTKYTSPITFNERGFYTFGYYSGDVVGNRERINVRTAVIDNEKPVINFSFNFSPSSHTKEDFGYVTTHEDFLLEYEIESLSLKSLEIMRDGKVSKNITSFQEFNSENLSFLGFERLPLQDGLNEFKIIATNEFGRSSEKDFNVLYYDGSPEIYDIYSSSLADFNSGDIYLFDDQPVLTVETSKVTEYCDLTIDGEEIDHEVNDNYFTYDLSLMDEGLSNLDTLSFSCEDKLNNSEVFDYDVFLSNHSFSINFDSEDLYSERTFKTNHLNQDGFPELTLSLYKDPQYNEEYFDNSIKCDYTHPISGELISGETFYDELEISLENENKFTDGNYEFNVHCEDKYGRSDELKFNWIISVNKEPFLYMESPFDESQTQKESGYVYDYDEPSFLLGISSNEILYDCSVIDNLNNEKIDLTNHGSNFFSKWLDFEEFYDERPLEITLDVLCILPTSETISETFNFRIDETYNKIYSVEDLNDDSGDGVENSEDNCRNIVNPFQNDLSNDGRGDLCDVCFNVYNPEQNIQEGSFLGDSCLLDCERDEFGGCIEDDDRSEFSSSDYNEQIVCDTTFEDCLNYDSPFSEIYFNNNFNVFSKTHPLSNVGFSTSDFVAEWDIESKETRVLISRYSQDPFSGTIIDSSEKEYIHDEPLSDGTWYFNIGFIDEFGNERQYNHKFIVDTKKPELIDINGLTQKTDEKYQKLEVELNEPGYVEFVLNDNKVYVPTREFNGRHMLEYVYELKEGQNEYFIKVHDRAIPTNNFFYDSGEINYITEGPSLDDVNFEDKLSSLDELILTYETQLSSVVDCSLSSFEFVNESGDVFELPGICSSNENKVSFDETLDNGIYQINARACNEFNICRYNNDYSIEVDSNSPSIVFEEDNLFNEEKINYDVECISNSGQNIDNLKCELNNNYLYDAISSNNIYSFDLNLNSGDNFLECSCEDVNGNTISNTKELILDNKKPIFKLLSSTNIDQENYLLKAEAFDNHELDDVIFDYDAEKVNFINRNEIYDENRQALSLLIDLNVSESFNLGVEATDKAGNVINEDFEFISDNQAPEILSSTYHDAFYDENESEIRINSNKLNVDYEVYEDSNLDVKYYIDGELIGENENTLDNSEKEVSLNVLIEDSLENEIKEFDFKVVFIDEFDNKLVKEYNLVSDLKGPELVDFDPKRTHEHQNILYEFDFDKFAYCNKLSYLKKDGNLKEEIIEGSGETINHIVEGPLSYYYETETNTEFEITCYDEFDNSKSSTFNTLLDYRLLEVLDLNVYGANTLPYHPEDEIISASSPGNKIAIELFLNKEDSKCRYSLYDDSYDAMNEMDEVTDLKYSISLDDFNEGEHEIFIRCKDSLNHRIFRKVKFEYDPSMSVDIINIEPTGYVNTPKTDVKIHTLQNSSCTIRRKYDNLVRDFFARWFRTDVPFNNQLYDVYEMVYTDLDLENGVTHNYEVRCSDENEILTDSTKEFNLTLDTVIPQISYDYEEFNTKVSTYDVEFSVDKYVDVNIYSNKELIKEIKGVNAGESISTEVYLFARENHITVEAIDRAGNKIEENVADIFFNITGPVIDRIVPDRGIFNHYSDRLEVQFSPTCYGEGCEPDLSATEISLMKNGEEIDFDVELSHEDNIIYLDAGNLTEKANYTFDVQSYSMDGSYGEGRIGRFKIDPEIPILILLHLEDITINQNWVNILGEVISDYRVLWIEYDFMGETEREGIKRITKGDKVEFETTIYDLNEGMNEFIFRAFTSQGYAETSTHRVRVDLSAGHVVVCDVGDFQCFEDFTNMISR
ncbi:MAG: hypothetical protein ACOCQD_01285 [archaeon]